MFIVKADHPAVPYTITPPQVTDSEGNPVAVDSLAFTVETSNPEAVAVIPDPPAADGTPGDPLKGMVSFGRPNPDGTPSTAAVTVLVSDKATGSLLGSFGAQFTIPAGDPAAIVGGAITFEGLTEV